MDASPSPTVGERWHPIIWLTLNVLLRMTEARHSEQTTTTFDVLELWVCQRRR